MKMKRKTALYLSLIIYFVMFVLYSQNTYLLTRPYSVEVVQKYSGVDGGSTVSFNLSLSIKPKMELYSTGMNQLQNTVSYR